MNESVFRWKTLGGFDWRFRWAYDGPTSSGRKTLTTLLASIGHTRALRVWLNTCPVGHMAFRRLQAECWSVLFVVRLMFRIILTECDDGRCCGSRSNLKGWFSWLLIGWPVWLMAWICWVWMISRFGLWLDRVELVWAVRIALSIALIELRTDWVALSSVNLLIGQFQFETFYLDFCGWLVNVWLSMSWPRLCCWAIGHSDEQVTGNLSSFLTCSRWWANKLGKK